jgi:hypothetical protein
MASIYGKSKLEVVSSGLSLYINPSIVAPISTTVYDVNNVACGTINNSTAFYDSNQYGGIFTFGGGNQSIIITPALSFIAGCTIQVMLRRSTAGNGQYTTFSTVFGSRSPNKLICFDSNGGTQNYTLESDNNGGTSVSPIFNSQTGGLISGSAIPDWYLLTFVNSNATNGPISLYKNNQTTAYSITGSLSSATLNLRIGEDNPNSRFFKGDMGAFLFYNKVLTLSEITQNYYNFAKRFSI